MPAPHPNPTHTFQARTMTGRLIADHDTMRDLFLDVRSQYPGGIWIVFTIPTTDGGTQSQPLYVGDGLMHAEVTQQ